jgi:hypothetical protein
LRPKPALHIRTPQHWTRLLLIYFRRSNMTPTLWPPTPPPFRRPIRLWTSPRRGPVSDRSLAAQCLESSRATRPRSPPSSRPKLLASPIRLRYSKHSGAAGGTGRSAYRRPFPDSFSQTAWHKKTQSGLFGVLDFICGKRLRTAIPRKAGIGGAIKSLICPSGFPVRPINFPVRISRDFAFKTLNWLPHFQGDSRYSRRKDRFSLLFP